MYPLPQTFAYIGRRVRPIFTQILKTIQLAKSSETGCMQIESSNSYYLSAWRRKSEIGVFQIQPSLYNTCRDVRAMPHISFLRLKPWNNSTPKAKWTLHNSKWRTVTESRNSNWTERDGEAISTTTPEFSTTADFNMNCRHESDLGNSKCRTWTVSGNKLWRKEIGKRFFNG